MQNKWTDSIECVQTGLLYLYGIEMETKRQKQAFPEVLVFRELFPETNKHLIHFSGSLIHRLAQWMAQCSGLRVRSLCPIPLTQ